MASVVKMPKWGLTMTVGTITDWLVEEGAEVSEGSPLLTVETEKAVNDVEAPADGVLVRIVGETGREIAVSAPIAVIAAEGEELSADEIDRLLAEAAPKKKGAAAKESGDGERARPGQAAARDDSGRVNASPAARRRAQELGVDLAAVEATGPGGRITSEDVERAAADAGDDPSPREERVALADGRELNVLTAGPADGQAIVFVHGLGGSLSTWQLVLGELAERYRVVAVDLPGHGASDAAADADYSVAGHAAAVSEVVRAKVKGPAVVVGHSLGAAVALTMALDAADGLAGLVLVNGAGLGPTISSELTELMAGEPGEATARGLLTLFYADERLVSDRAAAEMAATQTAEGAWAAQQATATAAFEGQSQRLDLHTRLGQVTVPVHIVWGEKDRVLPLAEATAALLELPDATLRVLPRVGHVPQVEAAERTAGAIGRFARSVA